MIAIRSLRPLTIFAIAWPSASQRRGPGVRTGGGARGFARPTEREPAAGQQLERPWPPHARDQPEVVAARRTDEDIDGALGIAVLEQRGGERHARSTDEALVQPQSQLEVLLSGGQCGVEVARRDRRERALNEVPG